MEFLPDLLTASRQLQSGELSSVMLLEHCLARIDRFENQVQAWVKVYRAEAMRQAETADSQIANGKHRGPLHGIPIGVKDIVDVAGMPTKAGSTLFGDDPVAKDAPLVSRLREAGAVIMGKTVTTEFACFDPSPTRNPWNIEHTPGGSSSGSSAATALEMCFAAIGSQTGGSITRPASYCGVTGLKPTFGAVDATGVVPISGNLDHVGPIARSVGDLAVMFAALTGDGPLADFKPSSSPPKLQFIKSYFHENSDPSVSAVTQAAYQKLLHDGASFAELELPPSFEAVHAMHRCIMAVDAAETHCETFEKHKDTYGPNVASLIQEGLATFAVEYALALRHYKQFRKDIDQIIAPGTIAITPATPTPAPAGLESTGDPMFNSPWSYCGLPTVNIPCGLAENGMPCGLQLIAARHCENALLAAAAWCEQSLDFADLPPMVGP